MPQKTVKGKIIKVVLLTIFVSGFLCLIVVLHFSYTRMIQEKKSSKSILVDEQSNKISVYFKESQQAAVHLASLDDLINWVENPQVEERNQIINLLNNLNINQRYSAVYLMDYNGKVLAANDLSLIGNNYAFREYFKQAISGKDSLEMAIGVTTGRAGYYFASPMKNKDKEIVGVVVLKMDEEFLNEILQTSNLGENEKLMFSDRNGVVLYSNLPERIYKSLGVLDEETKKTLKDKKIFADIDIKSLQYQLVQDFIKSNQKKVQVINVKDEVDGENEILTVAPVSGSQFYLIIETDFEEIIIQSIKLAILLGLFILLFIVMASFFILIVVNKNLKSLKFLSGMAEKIGQGDYIEENPINSNDDIEKLGDVFVEMSQRLKKYYENLENKVAERTKELETKNKMLDDAKRATINVLEDVEKEKSKIIELAKDLEKFKLALDNASDHIVITDSEGMVLYGNKGVERVTGYTVSESLGKKAGTLWSLPMPLEYYKKLWKTIKTDKKTFAGDIKNRRKSGEEYEAYVTISPVLNSKSEVEFFVGIERDITHEKSVDRAKTEFVSLASHQLRTPLSSINWYAEMLLAGDGGKLSEEQTNFVREIYNGNQRMVELVNALLNVSRLELGTFAVDPVPTNIIKIAQEVLSELKPGIANKKMKVVFDYDKTLPIISADPKLIRIVFQNLLSNSIKYTQEKGEIKLAISYNKKNLLIVESDNGYGIPKNQQDKIFSKLFRADNIREKDTEGTGLGLYIIKSIVDHAGGTIKFESEEDKGTKFYISLPLTGMKKKAGSKPLE